MNARLIHDAAKRLEEKVIADIQSGTNIAEIIDFIIAIGALPTDPDHEYSEQELARREAIIDPIAQRIYGHILESGAVARAAVLAVTEELQEPYKEHIATVAKEAIKLFTSGGDKINFLIDALNPHLLADDDESHEKHSSLEHEFYAATREDMSATLHQIFAAHISALIDRPSTDDWTAAIRELSRIFEVVTDLADETDGLLTVRVLRSSLGLDRGSLVRLAPPSQSGSVSLAVVDADNSIIANIIDVRRDE